MPRTKVTLTPAEFARICKLVHSRSGMELPANRQGYVEMRLSERFCELGIHDVPEYMERLILSAGPDGEFLHFIESLVVQETFFFRHGGHFSILRAKVLPEILGAERRGPARRIRVWSAGCANGAEPYSLAIDLLEAVPRDAGWGIEVLATDISAKSLEEARVGRFSPRMVRHVPPELLARHFVPAADGASVSEAVKAVVKFQQHNLMDGGYPTELDAIFCRNVLIYFDQTDREKIVTGFHAGLRQTGHLFLGHSETLRDFPHLFEIVWHDGSFAYRKRDRRHRGTEIRSKRTTVDVDLLRRRMAEAPPAASPPPAAAPGGSSPPAPAPPGGGALPARRKSDIHVLALAGALDTESCGSSDSPVKAQLLRVIEEGSRAVVIDLEKVNFLDAQGMALLTRVVSLIRGSGGRVRFVAANTSVRRWLEKPQYAGVFELFATEDDARAAFRQDRSGGPAA